MPEIKVDVVGIPGLEAALRQLGNRVERVLEGAVRQAARVVATEARGRAPVDTGTLRRSITAAKLESLAVAGSMFVDYGVGVERNKTFRNADGYYARFLEFGTKKMSARPWLRPALDARAQEVQQVIERTIRRAAERVGRR